MYVYDIYLYCAYVHLYLFNFFKGSFGYTSPMKLAVKWQALSKTKLKQLQYKHLHVYLEIFYCSKFAISCYILYYKLYGFGLK